MEVSGKLAEAKQEFYFCEHCQFENVTSESNGICRECGEYMCDTCFRHHLKSKRHRGHELIDISDPDVARMKSAGEVEKCKQHRNEEIKFYCREHETVGCGDCFIFEHRACKPEYIKDLSKNIQETEDFINLKRKIEHLESKNESNIENIRQNRKDCSAMHDEVLTEIRKFRTGINNYLDDAESAIISELKQLITDNDKRLDKLDNDCAQCLSDIDTLTQTLDQTVQRENLLFIQTVRGKVSILEIEHELSKTVKSVHEAKRYEFVPNQQLASIIKSRGKFGELNISNKKECKPDKPTHLKKDADTLSLMEPNKPVQLHTDRETDVRPSSVVVGSRVERNVSAYCDKGQPGTVTNVHLDRTVIVKWDATGHTVPGYKVGTRPCDIKLI